MVTWSSTTLAFPFFSSFPGLGAPEMTIERTAQGKTDFPGLDLGAAENLAEGLVSKAGAGFNLLRNQ